MIFLDSNVPVYLVGAPHPNRDLAFAAVERVVRRGERIVTSAEVLQELLHLYSHRTSLQMVQSAFDVIHGLVDEVYPVDADDVERAYAVLRAHPGLSSRDALHVAVMQRREVTRVLTFDRDFDRIATIERVH